MDEGLHGLIETQMQFTIFCTVVDNFGDIGICWRLARQLHQELQQDVVLYVDDLSSFQRICPEVNPSLDVQQVQGVQVGRWQSCFTALPSDKPDVVIEAFACQLPLGYLAQCEQLVPAPTWINLEYLTAEAWAADCHGLASPQAGSKLKKFFYFPGFTERYGGLLREVNVVDNAYALRDSPALQQQFWHQIGIDDAMTFARKISLFGYSQSGINNWLQQLSHSPITTLLLVPQGALAEQIMSLYPELAKGRVHHASLAIQVLPFVAQPLYDLLLAACDFNFVRGEDSIIRAHWAGRPFIWQIYRQDEQAHLEKLHAFLDLMLKDASIELASLVRTMHDAWEQEIDFASVWPVLEQNWSQYAEYVLIWQRKLMAHEDLASNLVRFAKNKHIIPRTFS